jgi:hypothetical protein
MENESYYLGILVGEIIHIKYLPTLETDMIETNRRIRITDVNDLSENLKLNKVMDDLVLSNRLSNNDLLYNEAHANWLAHTNMLAKKYLPEKLECRLSQFEVSDKESFKKGLDDYLWDCDVSWYVAKDDFLPPNFERSWYSTIVLTRTV